MKKIVPLILTLSVVFQLIAPCLVYADNAEARDVSAKKASLTEAADYNEYIKSLPENAASTDLSVSLLNGDKRTLADGKPLKTVFECKQSGLYSLKFNYAPLSENNASFNLKIDIDGAVPFFGASSVKLPCFYTVDNITVNADGDDVRPNVKLDKSYHSFTLSDKNTAAPYEIYLKEGAHSLSMSVDQGELNISDIVLFGYKAPPAYEEYKNKYPAVYEGDALPLTEAESFLYTNSNYIIASSDAGSAETTPSNPYNKKINTVGGSNWKSSGDVIAWETEAPEEGLYSISFRYKQNFQSGLNSYRTLYVNGEIPYKEAISIAFPYNNDWQVKEFEYKIHLNKGKNIIALEITADEIYDIIIELNDAVTELNTLYRSIIMITGASPDSYRDYNLQDEIPELDKELSLLAEKIENIYKEAHRHIDGSGQLYVLQDTYRQLRDMAGNLRSITKNSRLSRFKSNISSISSLITKLQNQPLMLDSVSIFGQGENAFASVGFGGKLKYRIKRFFSTFSKDYAKSSKSAKEIDVWIPSGRDQLQILSDIIDNDFTPKNGIKVNLKLVNGSLIHAVLAGKAPDVSLSHSETDIINFAMRGATEDLSKYAGYNDVINRFSGGAAQPYEYKSGVYALPETQTFQMMFVRTDILSELGLKIPNTWNEIIKNVLPALSRNNLTIGVGNLNTSGSLQSIYTTILTQSGGSLYSDDLLSADLSSNIALYSFDFVVSLYRNYGLPQEYDFINRFRTGEMPIALSAYTTYNQLQISAPEISGLWGMYEIPGTADENGNINRSQIMSSTGAVMLSASDKKEESWKFLKWFTSAEIQRNYGLQLEAVLGESGRYATANIKAMSGLLWQADQLSVLENQRSESISLVQVPGSYYVGKALNNATVISVTNTEKIAKEELSKWDELIDAEISRKSKEFKFSGKKG